MLKTILRVLYFAFAAVIAVVVYMYAYQSAALDKITNRINNYVETKDYDSIARMFGGITNTAEPINVLDESFDLMVYEGTTEVKYAYYTEENTTDDEGNAVVNTIEHTYHAYDKAYYLYLFNPTFSTQNIIVNNEITNNSGIRFYSDSSYYDFYFTITKDVNKDYYVAKPKTVDEACLGSNNLSTTYNNWGFYGVVLNESIISAIEAKMESPIVGLNVINADGNNVLTENVAFDFSFESQFYTDIKAIFDAYDKYLPIADGYAAGTKESAEYDEALALFNEETKGIEELLNKDDNTYVLSFTQKELVPSSTIGSAIGIVALFVLCVIILYVLLFHFAFIKRVVLREKKQTSNHTSNKIAPKKEAIIKASVKEVEKPTEPKALDDELIETVEEE